jgi:hypothetical protein
MAGSTDWHQGVVAAGSGIRAGALEKSLFVLVILLETVCEDLECNAGHFRGCPFRAALSGLRR